MSVPERTGALLHREVIPELNVILGGWRPVTDAGSGAL
jgi:hypothetical protein